VAGTRARGPTHEPQRIARHLAVVVGVLSVLACIALAPHAWDRGRAAIQQAPFVLSDVRVRGLDRLTPATLREVLALQPGIPLVELDVAAAEARLEAHPWIAEATVVRWPPDGLRVQVREQVPLAVTGAGEPNVPHAVNETGMAFAPASDEDVARLVAVVLATPARVGEPDPRLLEALRLAASLRSHGIEVPRELRLGLPEREQSAQIRLRGFEPTIWIERSLPDEQIDRLAALLAANLETATQARLIDLRFAGRAVLWSGE
jgi:cell division protein FtsQ